MRIGIDLGGTKIEIVALDSAGTEVVRRRIPTPRAFAPEDRPEEVYARIVDALVGLVHGVEAELGGARASVGIGTPGAVSPATGRIKNSNTTCLIGRPLQEDLEQALQRPVRLSNDANCFALSEASDGAAAGAEVVFGVILGTGVGGGIVVSGRPLAGRNAIAGEWGHNPLPWPTDDERPGPACYCGRHGCIETFLSGPGLLRDHVTRGGARTDGAELAAAAARGEPLARETLERHADRLARALASVINVLDPDAIVLGGGVSNIRWLYEAVPQRWGAWVFSDRVDTALRPAAHGDSSGVRGAAWLWPER
ncbi:ROK family protein [Paraliomyxa miuraensis]|uniref:ROK family protein n=1 Tax=Paraliomyxa miuraensis TaxID=376150 RepID=UPI002253B816|nr:ROK family protein [Paraliomyxa miuraensis]MCX4243473.1 ROK family protein [Paraliomyxa miuraensis]